MQHQAAPGGWPAGSWTARESVPAVDAAACRRSGCRPRRRSRASRSTSSIARQQGLVVLQVGVDHRHEGRRGGQHALDAGRRQPAPADPLHAAHAAVLPRESRAPVRAVPSGESSSTKISSQSMPGSAALDAVAQLGHVVGLVEGGDDYRQLRHRNDRASGACSAGALAKRSRLIRRLRRCPTLAQRAAGPGAGGPCSSCRGRSRRGA